MGMLPARNRRAAGSIRGCNCVACCRQEFGEGFARSGEEGLTASLAEIEAALRALERQLPEDERGSKSDRPARRLTETVLISLVLSLLLLCAGAAIAGARFLTVHGSDVWNQFNNEKAPSAESAR